MGLHLVIDKNCGIGNAIHQSDSPLTLITTNVMRSKDHAD